MKQILLVIVFLLSVSVHSQDEVNWGNNLEVAMKKAKVMKKHVLVYFTGSDWCAPCKMLKEDFFSTDRFKKQASHFVLVEVDLPRRIDIITETQRKKNKRVIAKYNKDSSFPKLVVLNYRGKSIGEKSGYILTRDPSYHFTFLDKIIEKK